MFARNRIVGLWSIVIALAITSAPLAAWAQPARRDTTIRTRVLAWPGGDRLVVATSADVRYVQGPAAKVVITGPTDQISDIVVDGGVIRHDRDRWGWDWRWWRLWSWRPEHQVRIVVTAPQIDEASVSGSGHLDLGRLSQDRLDLNVSGSGGLDVSGQFRTLGLTVSGSGSARLTAINAGDMTTHISGSGWIKATGAASSLRVSISGSGSADMGGVSAQDADAGISGSGSTTLSPHRYADVSVSGSGSVRLLTNPARLNSHRSGSGAIIQPS
jgi:hypothetical protein